MHSIIALWSPMRARSTAFFRMMIERKDVLVIHEPLVTLLDEGEVPVPDGAGGSITLRTEEALFSHLRFLATRQTVFFKETVEHRFNYLFDRPSEIADLIHAFIVRDPRKTIPSMYRMKPDIVSPQIGYENLHDLFQLCLRSTGRIPLVMHSDRLAADPRAVISDFCDYAGLVFDPAALRWEPGSQPHWARTGRWHEDVSRSRGFSTFENEYAHTVDNSELLNGFFRYHNHFYQKILPYCN